MAKIGVPPFPASREIHIAGTGMKCAWGVTARAMRELLQLAANGLVAGAIIALGAVGLTLVYGILKIANFAHGEFLTFGVYMAFLINVTVGLGIVFGAAVAVVAAALLALLLELVLWRPMRRRRAGLVSLFIASIGLALVLRHLIFIGWGARPRRLAVDVFQTYELGPVRMSLSQVMALVVAVAAVGATGLLLARSTLGKQMRAVADDRELASVSGVDVGRTTLVVWILGGALAGLAGVMQGLVQNSFNPQMGYTLLLPIFAAVVLGGVGDAYGALMAGLVLGLAMELATWSGLGGGIPHVYKLVVAFAVLIGALLLRPQGLLGRARTP